MLLGLAWALTLTTSRGLTRMLALHRERDVKCRGGTRCRQVTLERERASLRHAPGLAKYKLSHCIATRPLQDDISAPRRIWGCCSNLGQNKATTPRDGQPLLWHLLRKVVRLTQRLHRRQQGYVHIGPRVALPSMLTYATAPISLHDVSASRPSLIGRWHDSSKAIVC